jgi:single-stranded DNA-binding protein
VNSVNLIGTLVGEPALGVAVEGEDVCTMRLAVPRVGRFGMPEPGVVYVEVTATGLRGRELADEVEEGMRIGVSGRLELDEWVTPEGERVSRFEVAADQLEVLDAPRGSGS